MLESSLGESGPGTVGLFNFIRRIGFPYTAELVSAFVTMIFLSMILSLPGYRLSLQSVFGYPLVAIVLPTILGELVTSTLVLRDEVLTFRRLMGLEVLSWALTPLILPLSAVIYSFGIGLTWQTPIVFVLAISLPIRTLSFVSLTDRSILKRVLASLLVPLFVSIALIISSPTQTLVITTALSLVAAASVAGVVRLVQGLDREGSAQIGAPPMQLFRAFLRHWLNRDPESLEENLTRLGLDDEIRTNIIAFFGKNGKRKGALVVSSFHPGPYRDLGSGGLPSQLKQHLEDRVGGVVHVPHGISGHQSNIISRKDVWRFLLHVESNYPAKPTTATASVMVRRVRETAKASGQLFDHTALITLTLSPENMEDMPSQLGETINKTADSLGLGVAIVDAHNSMSVETLVTPAQADHLALAADDALRSLNRLDQSGFKAGFSADSLHEFRLEDGIGPGGVSVLVLSNQGRRAAYVTIDGNNMEPGFRETILSSLSELGIADGEIMTTDTHLVTGLVRSPLGYYPVGAHLDKSLLITKIRDAVKRGIDDLEDASLGVSTSSIRLRVLGKETFENVTSYIRHVGIRVRSLFYLLQLVSITIALLVLAIM
jgi:putative membrane protein